MIYKPDRRAVDAPLAPEPQADLARQRRQELHVAGTARALKLGRQFAEVAAHALTLLTKGPVMAPVTPPKRAPIEAKTQAAGLAGAVAGALIWVLGQYVFKGTVASGLQSLIYAAVPGVLAFAAAYLAPHTPRPPAPPAGSQP